jgi:DNA-binding beta-propeller fold protein YncE
MRSHPARHRRARSTGGLFAVALLAASLAHAAPAGDIAPSDARRVVVGGSGGWDYLTLDAARHRLFISRASRVQVFDTVAERVVAEIDDTAGVHGVVLAEELSRGFTSDGKSNSVSIFDLQSLRTIDRIKGVGDGPDAIAYDRKTARVFTFNGRSKDATAIDAASGRVVATVALRGRPEFAVADGEGTLFVNIEDKNLLQRIDAATAKATSAWPMAGCDEPTGLAIDAPHRRLFAVCANRRMVVMDADSGKVVSELPIGAGADAVVFDPRTSLAISSNGDGTVTVVRQRSTDDYAVVATLHTQRGARTLALDSPGGRVYLVTSDFEAAAGSAATRRPAQVPGTFSVLVLDLSSIR